MKIKRMTSCLIISAALFLSHNAFAAEELQASIEPPKTNSATVVEDMESSPYAYLTSYAKRDDSGCIYIGYDVTDQEEIVFDDHIIGPAYTAVYSHGAQAQAFVSGVLAATDDTSGEQASDFSGQGSLVVANDGGAISIFDANVYSDGFERTAILVSQKGTVYAEDSTFTVMGANPLTESYEGYENSANQNLMLSPPWALGIQGAARVVNMLGESPTLTVVDCNLISGGWALFSTDAGSNMRINSIDSNLRILCENDGGLDSGWRILGYEQDQFGSGYGSFYIGGSSQYHYGEHIDAVTYGAIFGNGSGTGRYASSRGSIEIYDAEDNFIKTVDGSGRPTVIHCVFGFLAHRQVTDGVFVEDGTEIYAEDAIVIYKNGSSDWYFDNCILSSKKAVLFQMADNDDDTRIGNNPNGYGFNTTYDEENVAAAPGFPGINYNCATVSGGDTVTATYTNGEYVGNIYNGTGYYGQTGDKLKVTIGENAVLTGDISLTSTIKGILYSKQALDGVRYYGDDIAYLLLDKHGEICGEEDAAYIQFRSYTINEYFLQGHMENKNFFNGSSTLEVLVAENGIWNVSEDSLITTLIIEDGAVVNGVLTENEDGTITLHPGAAPIPVGTYGTIAPTETSSGGGSGDISASTDPSRG